MKPKDHQQYIITFDGRKEIATCHWFSEGSKAREKYGYKFITVGNEVVHRDRIEGIKKL